MGKFDCGQVRSWERRAKTLTDKAEILRDQIKARVGEGMPSNLERTIVYQLQEVIDRMDIISANLDALAAEVSR